MKYKNFGSVVASSSNASSQGGGGGGGNNHAGLQSQTHSQHSTRTATTTHRSSDRRTTTTTNTNTATFYGDEELISINNSLSGGGQQQQQQKDNGILHKLQRHIDQQDQDEDEYYHHNNNRNNNRNQHRKYHHHDDDDEDGRPVFEEYRLAEDREPSSSRSRGGNNTTTTTTADDAGSMNTNHTPNTVTSSSRRAKKLAYVGYVPVVEVDNSNSTNSSSRSRSNRQTMLAVQEEEHQHQQQKQQSDPFHHFDDNTNQGEEVGEGEEGRDESSPQQYDREVAAITQVVSDTSSTQVAVSREFSPASETLSSSRQGQGKEKELSSFPKKCKPTTLSGGIHTMDDDQVRGVEQRKNEEEEDTVAMESRNLRRQRLAKKYNHAATATAGGGVVIAGDNRSVGASTTASSSMTSVFPNPVPTKMTASTRKQPQLHQQRQQEEAPLSPASPKTPVATVPSNHNDEGAVSPTSPSARKARLSRIMRRAQQNQRAIASQIADQQQRHQQQQRQQSQPHILHQVDGMNAAVAHAARMARSESEVEPTSPRSTQKKEFHTMLGLSPPRHQQASQQQQPQPQQRLSAGLSPHRQQQYQYQQSQHQQPFVRGAIRHPASYPDNITPPSLVAPYPTRPRPTAQPQQQQTKQQKQQQHHYPMASPAQVYNPYLHHQQFMMQQQHQQYQQQQFHHAAPGGSNRSDQRSFHQYNPSPASSHHLRQQQQQYQQQHMHVQQQQEEDPSFGAGSRVRQYPPAYPIMSNAHAPPEERSAAEGAISPASMHIASSEWTAAAEENQAGMFCGPNGPRLKNVHFVRGGNGFQNNPCEPIGLKCQSLVSNLVNTCAALSHHTYHTDSKRSQFEKVAEESISKLTAGFLDHDFSTTLGPHWQNYGAYFSQETGKSSYYPSSEEGDDVDDDDDEQSELDDLAMATEDVGPKDEVEDAAAAAAAADEAYDDSFAASARRFLQAGNDIMGTLPTEFQNLTQSTSHGVFAQGNPMAVAGDQGAAMVKDVKNLFDTFQRYYEPEEVVYEGKQEFQQDPIPLDLQQSPYNNNTLHQPYPMPIPSRNGLVGEFHQGMTRAQEAYHRAHYPANHVEQYETMTQEKLDVLTGIRRRRHKAFPFNAPSPQNPADSTSDQQQQQEQTPVTKGEPAIDASYDKTRVRRTYRNLTDRIRDKSASKPEPREEKDKKDAKKNSNDEATPVKESRQRDDAEETKEKAPPNANLSPRTQSVEKPAEAAVEKAEYSEENQTKESPAVDTRDEQEFGFEDAQQAAKSSTEHSRSASRRSEESRESSMSFQTAQYCASISRHETVHHLAVDSFEEIKEQEFKSTEDKEDDDIVVAKEEDQKEEQAIDAALSTEQIDDDDIEEIIDDNNEGEVPSPSPSDESMDSPELHDAGRYSPNIAESSSLQNTFSIPNQSTAKSLETCNTDDLVSAFLAPPEDELLERENEAPERESDPLTSEDPNDSSSPSDSGPSTEELATYLTSSSGMSDSLVGSDMSEGSPSTTNSFSEQVAEEMASFDESPMTFHHQHHPMMKLDEEQEEADQFAMSDPTMQTDSESFEQPEFPHTPLDVIEEEASNAEELDSVVPMHRYNSNEFQHQPSMDEDVDIFSLQQNTATQDSLSTDETDADFQQQQETDAEQEEPAMLERNAGIMAKPSPGVATVNVILKFVFTTVMIYYIGFIFNIWERAETFLPKLLGGDGGRTAGPPANAPSKRESSISSISPPPSNAAANNEDWQVLNRLVEDALKSPSTANNNNNKNNNNKKASFIPSSVPTRTPKNEWQQELEEALEDEELLNRVKTMLVHDQAIRNGNGNGMVATTMDDDYNNIITEEDLEHELMELRMSRQTKIEKQEDNDDNDDNNQEQGT